MTRRSSCCCSCFSCFSGRNTPSLSGLTEMVATGHHPSSSTSGAQGKSVASFSSSSAHQDASCAVVVKQDEVVPSPPSGGASSIPSAPPCAASSSSTVPETATSSSSTVPGCSRDRTSSASTSQGNTNSYVYQVFLNHRGPDVKEGLAKDIYNRLKKLGLSVFLDQEELQRGEKLDAQIEGAIRTATVQVAIFSPNYAQSRWCLDELVQMLESGSTIIPVFYKVEPADLRWTRGGDRVYAQHLGVLEGKRTFDGQPRYDPKIIEEWRNALSAVADIVGFELKDKEESQLVQEVVQRVVEKARKPPLDVAKYPTGLDEKIEDVDRTLSLQRQSKKATILGIVGVGGVGKTTLAKQFFNRERSNYSRSCFLFDVRSTSLPSLQSSLLKELIKLNAQINSVDEGTGMLKETLKRDSQRSLIILDDIDNIDQLDALCAPVIDTIYVGSLILITSRNKDVLRNFGIDESSIYTLKGLNVEHSQELFCCHAFGRPSPVVGFEEVVQEFLNVCNGLPLSLKVLGALLSGKDDLKLWNAQLLKTSEVLPEDIRSTLRISYDALDEEEQQIFLDIACFFIGEDTDTAIRVWDGSNWEGLLGLWTLENRCLVEVDSKNRLRMHDHLRELGREIAEDPEYPRRLWHFTENLLHNMSGQSFVRGISMFDENDSEQSFENLVGSFNLSRLQLLRTESDSVDRIFSSEQLRPLVYLHWKHCPKSSLAPSIPLNNLNVLHIEGNQLETLWQHEFQAPLQLRELHIDAHLSEVPKSIGKLKHLEKVFLNTSYLKTISNEFWNLSGLQTLHLKCSDLQTLPESIGNLTGLQRLDLSWFTNLQTLPDSVGNLTGLQRLDLCDCFELQTLPDSLGKLTDLQGLNLKRCYTLKMLPDSLGKLTGLQRLNLKGCSSLQTLPESMGNLTGLQRLDLTNCRNVKMLPDSVGNLTGFQRLDLTNCYSLQTLPEWVGNLTGFQRLDLTNCYSLQTLPESVGNLTGLQSLDLTDCRDLKMLPDSLGKLTGLQCLDLNGCSTLKMLPDSVGNLSGLQSLELTWCSSLQTLPDSVGKLTGLQRLDLNGCSTLKMLPDSVGNLSGLQSLDLTDCGDLKMLPDSVENVTGLQRLNLNRCSTLKMLPDSVGNLSGLQSLELTWCSSLQTLPDSVGKLTGLQRLDLNGCSTLKMLPDSVGNLSGLQSLKLNWCSRLQTLPDSVANLSGLQSLELNGCSKLQTLPDWVGNLTGLQRLELKGCRHLHIPDSVWNLNLNLYGSNLLVASDESVSPDPASDESDESVPPDPASDESVPPDPASDESDESVPPDAASDESVPLDAASDGSVPRDAASDGSVPLNIRPEDAAIDGSVAPDWGSDESVTSKRRPGPGE